MAQFRKSSDQFFRLTIQPQNEIEDDLLFSMNFEVSGHDSNELEHRACDWLQKIRSKRNFEVQLMEELSDQQVYSVRSDTFLQEIMEKNEEEGS